MAETKEYTTLRELVPELRLAVQPHLLTLSGHLLAKGLITDDQETELRNESKCKKSRAADLVSMVMNKVKLDSTCFKTFITALKDNGVPYVEILITRLKQTELKLEPQATSKPTSKTVSPVAEVSEDISHSSIRTKPLSSNPPSYQCGKCHLCTGEQTIDVTFPLHNLDDREKEDYKFRLTRETKNIMMQFYRVESGLYKTVCENNMPLEQLKFHLRAVKASQNENLKESIFSEDQIQAATTVHDVFHYVCEFWSFIDYELLAHLIECLGSEDDKKRMVDYCKNFDQYAKRRITECPSVKSVNDDKWKNVYIKLDSKLEDVTISDLQELRFKVSEILDISVSAIRLCCIKQGCIEVTWQIPCFINKIVFPLSSDREKMLQQLHLRVVKLSCLDYIYAPVRAQ